MKIPVICFFCDETIEEAAPVEEDAGIDQYDGLCKGCERNPWKKKTRDHMSSYPG